MILMKLRYILLFAVSSLFLFSCVSKKKFTEMQTKMQARFDSLSAEYAKLQGELKTCNDQYCFPDLTKTQVYRDR